MWYVHPDTNEDIKYSYQDMSQASKKAANAILGLGVTKMVCILPKIPEWWIINVATIRANVTLLPGTIQLQAKDIEGRLISSGADCVIADPETAAKVDSLDQDKLQLRAKLIVGGEREGWLRWESLYDKAGEEHQAVNTHKDDNMQV